VKSVEEWGRGSGCALSVLRSALGDAGGAGAIERERLSIAGTFLEHSSVVDRQMLSHSTVKKDVRCLDLIGLHLIPR